MFKAPFFPNLKRIPNKKSDLLSILGQFEKPFDREVPHRVSYIIPTASVILTKNQIESCKKILNRKLKKFKSKSILLLRYNIVQTKKSIGSRMGKGKGKVIGRVMLARKNERLFQFRSLPIRILEGILLKINHKLPVLVLGSVGDSPYIRNIL